MSIEATAVVSFNSSDPDEDYIFKIELDDELNLDSEGKVKTSFGPGDEVFLFVNKSFNVDVTDVVCTAGSIERLGDGSRTAVSTHLFATREVLSADDLIEIGAGSKEPPGKYTLDVISVLCDISYIGNAGRLTQEVTDIDGLAFIPNRDYTPFIAKFDYTYEGMSYKLTPPILVLEEDETFSIAVVFYITVNEVI